MFFFFFSLRVSGKSLVRKKNVQILLPLLRLLLPQLLLLPQIRNLRLYPITLMKTGRTQESVAKIVNPVQPIKLIMDTGVVGEVDPFLPVMLVVEDATEGTSEKIKKMKKKVMRKEVDEIAVLEEDEDEVSINLYLFKSEILLKSGDLQNF